jgi:hypothetical protein
VDAISGRVTAKAPGTAEITVTTEDGAKKDYCTVTVTKADVPVTDVVLGPAAITLNKVGEEYQLNASVVPANADNKLLEWESDKPAVATVDETGKVTALTSGTANVKVKTSEGAKEKTCVVTVDILVTGVTLRSGLSLVLTDPDPESETLTATVTPDEALVRGVTWAIEPATGVATLTDNGDGTATVVASGEGTAVITVTTAQGDFTATCNVTVSLPPDKPVGADFTQATVYNFSGEKKFPEAFDVANASRFASMDLEHVFITGRFDTDIKPFLLSLEDLKNEIINPVFLDNLPEAGSYGYFPWANGQMVHGHIYSNSLVLAGNAGLNVHHWVKSAPEAVPTNITEGLLTDVEAGIRIGDAISVNLDVNGNGYIFMPQNGQPKILRITVKNFTEASDPVLLDVETHAGFYTTIKQVDGVPGEYILSGNATTTLLVDADMNTLYKWTTDPLADFSYARVISFNEARYLAVMNKANTTKDIAVYDITRGITTKDALETLDNTEDKEPLFTFSLNSVSTDGACSIDFAKDGDNKLYIIGSGQQAGFAIIELPAVEEE